MKNKYVIFVFMLLFCSYANAQNKKELRFKKDGTFKIVQFTDLHMCHQKKESQEAIDQIIETLDAEKPDFVMLTGDIVTGRPAREGWARVLAPIAERNLPFCVVLGNHDHEQDISREDIAQIIAAYPNSLNIVTEKQLGDLVLEVKKSNNAKETEALIYCMDSHDYSKLKNVKGYGWFTNGQVNWYRTMSKQYTQQNGGKPYTALAFFHIPLPEYGIAYKAKGSYPLGVRKEDECSPVINTGMFSAFLESGDVLGTFVGHDHDNDYLVPYYGIALTYGRFSGGNTIYNNLPHGIRLIELKEGKRAFETWVRVRGGEIVNKTSFDGVDYSR